MKFQSLILLGAIAALAAPVLAHDDDDDYGFASRTSNGWIIGHRASKTPQVAEYLGIPYAQPPVGDLRFAPPQKLGPQGMYVAKDYSPDCMYSRGGLIDYPNKTAQFDSVWEAFAAVNNNTQSEDCLTLNIWAKVPESPREQKPVLVLFHGGRWTSGTTNTPFYYGGYLANATDLLVVTVNYRMNIFGFPGIGDAPNPGLLDMRMAVEWLRDNVRSFGGDPNRITIAGQSCGSAAVSYWPYAYQSDPIVAGLISHSGTATSFPVNTPEQAATNWYAASETLGCGSSGDVMACMRAQNASDLLAAASQVKVPSTNPARKAPAFQPTVDNTTIFQNYTALSNQGNFSHIPYLLGHNNNEAGFYKIAAWAQGANLTDEQWDQFNEGTFSCPAAAEALSFVTAGVPTFRFRYYADWDNTRLYPTSGAYHGVDLNMIFGNSADYTGLPESQPQLELQSNMMAAWAKFASDPAAGLVELGWPVFDPTGSTLIQLGNNNTPTPSFIDPSIYDDVCASLTS